MRIAFLLPFIATACMLSLPNDAAAQTLVVGNKGEDSVSLIDLATGREGARLPTGANPHEVAVSPDGARAAVVHYGATTVDVIDIAGGKTLNRLELAPNARPHGIVWLKDGRLVITTEGSDTLTLADPAADRLLASIPTGQKGSHMVVVSPNARTAYITNLQSKTVSVVDLVRRRKLRDLQSGEEPEGLALTPDGRELWVANRRGGDVAVFRTRDLARVATVPVGRFPIRLAISPDGSTAVTSNNQGGDLTVIDVKTRAVIRTISVSGGPEAAQVTILFAPDGKRLFVAETGRATVAEVELAEGRVLRRLAAGKGADGLGYARTPVRPR